MLDPHLYDPCRGFLFASKNTLCSDNTGVGIDGAVHHVDADDVRALWIGIFMPHSNNYMRPWMPGEVAGVRVHWLHDVQDNSLVIKSLRKEMHEIKSKEV